MTVLPEVDEPTHEGLDELAHHLTDAWHDGEAEDSAA